MGAALDKIKQEVKELLVSCVTSQEVIMFEERFCLFGYDIKGRLESFKSNLDLWIISEGKGNKAIGRVGVEKVLTFTFGEQYKGLCAKHGIQKNIDRCFYSQMTPNQKSQFKRMKQKKKRCKHAEENIKPKRSLPVIKEGDEFQFSVFASSGGTGAKARKDDAKAPKGGGAEATEDTDRLTS